jgi:hypothetical protein
MSTCRIESILRRDFLHTQDTTVSCDSASDDGAPFEVDGFSASIFSLPPTNFLRRVKRSVFLVFSFNLSRSFSSRFLLQGEDERILDFCGALFLFLSLVHFGRGDISYMMTSTPVADGRSDES